MHRRNARTRTLCLLAILVASGSANCQPESRRLPYIPPKLHNWPEPYRGVPGLEAHVFVTGFVELPEALLVRGGAWTRIRQLPVTSLVLQHPQKGVLVVDSGLSKAVALEKVWPGSFLFPAEGLVQLEAAADLAEALPRAGIRPEAVRWIVQTNLRALRTGNLSAFPRATVVATTAERDYASRQQTGYDPALWAGVEQWRSVDFTAAQPLGTFERAVDLLGDGSVQLIDGRGPTPGTMIVLVRLPRRALLWASDVVPTWGTLRTAREPYGLWNGDAWWLTFWRVKRLADLAPEVQIVPAFDSTGRGEPSFPARFHELPTPATSPTRRPTPNPWERILPRPW